MRQLLTLVVTWLCLAALAGHVSAQDSHPTGFGNGKFGYDLAFSMGNDVDTSRYEFTDTTLNYVVNSEDSDAGFQVSITWEWLAAARDSIYGITLTNDSTTTTLDKISFSDGTTPALKASETKSSIVSIRFSVRPRW